MDVIINFFVVDTIFPTIIFSESKNEDGTIFDLSYNISVNNIRSTSNDEIHHIDISLGQSFVKLNEGSNLLPDVVSYDQNNPLIPLTVHKISNEYDETYYEANTYNITYESMDDSFNKTIVSVSFEIFDDIPPFIVASDNNNNYYTIYTSVIQNNDYDLIYHLYYSNYGTSGSGYTTDDGLHSFSFSSETEPFRSIDIHIKLDDLKTLPWYFPVAYYRNYPNDNSMNLDGVINLDGGINYSYDYIYFDENIKTDNSIIATQKFYISDSNNNPSEISFNVHIFDDTIPDVNVTYKRSSSQYGTNYIPYHDVNILVKNDIFQGPLDGDINDNITFEFTMDKACRCKVIFNSQSLSRKIFVNSDLSTNHTIHIGHNQVNHNVGSTEPYSIVFVIWDEYNNFFAFRKDFNMSNNPSPELVDVFAELSGNFYDLNDDFNDLSGKHYALENSFNEVTKSGDFVDLSINFYDLESSFNDLNDDFNDLSGKHYALENSFNEVTKSGDFADLSSNFYDLETSFNDLNDDFNDLSGKHYALENSFNEVTKSGDFADLSSNFYDLETEFDDLSSSYYTYKTRTDNSLNTI